ncbi:hypothetical protein TK90_2729 (plasmid) [Thioalkalivibrio sp. K90mix]|uniref:hypothetical protein n=1 Tax=Thioalkalivibrio sp. (strain K90mix) TaxID=396595 RepID=UPI000195A558|nr:hypothetical protein [Thioalkalivibrio sp. K90mix]ADC73215.1 hypothetical protein TK90_2729 [Thioalkalivibrio sp. K90mix]
MYVCSTDQYPDHPPAPFRLSYTPAFDLIPAGSVWLFRPAEGEGGEASIQFEDFGDDVVNALSESDYIYLVRLFSDLCVSIDFSQGVFAWPGSESNAIARQARMFFTDAGFCRDTLVPCCGRTGWSGARLG